MPKSSLLPIESLERQLRRRFPQAAIKMDRPRNRSGHWYLDVSCGKHPVVIQWKQGAGFGVSSSSGHAYGEGADEVYPDEEATYGRAVSLLLSEVSTSP